MEITPSTSFFDTVDRPSSPSSAKGAKKIKEGDNCSNPSNPFNDSFIGDIDISGKDDPNDMTFKQDLEEELETLRTETSSNEDSGSDSYGNSEEDSDEEEPSHEEEGRPELLEVEVAEIAHEKEKFLEGYEDEEEDLQDEPLDDDEPKAQGEPIKNSVGINIGFGKIKARKNPLVGLAKRLGGNSKNKDKDKKQVRESMSSVDAETEERKDKVVQELEALLSEGEEQPVCKPVSAAKPVHATRKEAVPNHFQAIVLTSVVADVGMAAAEAEAEANGWDVTVCICDTTGIPLQVKRSTLIRGSAASYGMAVQKAKMAAMFAQVTGGNVLASFSTNDEDEDQSQAALVAVYPFLHIGGGVPLILNGTCCGAVGISNGQVGATDQEQDQRVANAAVNAMADIYWSYQVLATEEA